MRLVRRFQNEHTLKRLEGSGWTCMVRTPEKEEQVKQAITANPCLSVQKIGRMPNVSTGTTHTTLRSLKLYPYRIPVHRKLKPSDYACCVNFCRWFNCSVQQRVDVLDDVFFTDKARVYLSGYVKSKNFRV